MATFDFYTDTLDELYPAISVLNTSPAGSGIIWGQKSSALTVSAMYAGPIAQQIANQMQQEMDSLTQPSLFDEDLEELMLQTDVQRCVEFRENYYQDMLHCADEFEAFQDSFSFKVGYRSEDPRESFLTPPSAAAYKAFLSF